MKIVFVSLSRRTFSDALEGVNSKDFSFAPPVNLGLSPHLHGQCPKLSAHTMYNTAGI